MEEPSSQVISEWKLVNSKFSFIMYADPFEWQERRAAPRQVCIAGACLLEQGMVDMLLFVGRPVPCHLPGYLDV